MVFHDEPFFQIYFGDAADKMYKEEYLAWHSQSLLDKPRIKTIAGRFKLKNIFFLRQIHSTDGYTITPELIDQFYSFSQVGDYLITREPLLGLGVMSADCLSVICFDKRTHAIGIAHAGWRGACDGIIPKMVRTMCTTWQTAVDDCYFFFGPSAKRCCYQVGPEFNEYLQPYPWAEKVLQQQSNGLFFDVPLLVSHQLYDLGVKPESIRTSYNSCTMCDERFYSHRRQSQAKTNASAGRQMTIVALK